MTTLRGMILALTCLVLFGQLPAAAQTPPDPATICKATPNDKRCIGFLGASSGINSLSGNVGNAQNALGTRVNSRFIVFLHSGGGARSVAENLSKALTTQGYTVRGIDEEIDSVGGAGVDYFNAQDAAAAAEVAELANRQLPAGRLKPRHQKISNPVGFLGVWLYGPKPN